MSGNYCGWAWRWLEIEFGNAGGLNPNSEIVLRVAATPRRRKVLATPSPPVGPVAVPMSEKMRRERRGHPTVTRRHRHPRLITLEFG